MKYFVSYSEIFSNDTVKREKARVLTYRLLLKFLDKRNIDVSNPLTDEFKILFNYFNSKEFTDVYFLSPYVLNERQMVKDVMDIIVKSGDTNVFNAFFNSIKKEVYRIKTNAKHAVTYTKTVKTADEYLDVYDENPNIDIELDDKDENDILDKVLKNNYGKDKKLSLLYLKRIYQVDKSSKTILRLIKRSKQLEKLFPNWNDLYLFIGDLYSDINCREKNNISQAFEYYLKAAENSSAEGIYNVGLAYLAGQGVAKDLDKALDCFSKAAVLNNEDAQAAMGIYYLAKKDKKQAKEWLEKSAKRGDYKAMLLLDTDFDRK